MEVVHGDLQEKRAGQHRLNSAPSIGIQLLWAGLKIWFNWELGMIDFIGLPALLLSFYFLQLVLQLILSKKSMIMIFISGL